MPGEEHRIAEIIVVTAKKMGRIKRLLAVEKVPSHFRESGKIVIEIVVGEKEVGPPKFEHRKNECRQQQVVPQ